MKPIPQSELETKLILQGVHLELTDALQQTLREKFGRLLTRNDHIVRIEARVRLDQTLGTEHQYTVVAQIVIGGPDLVASAEGKEVYTLIDEVVEKLDHLLERRHGKRKDHRNHPKNVEVGGAVPKTESMETANEEELSE
jgi:putative sigma-54 modulation protein